MGRTWRYAKVQVVLEPREGSELNTAVDSSASGDD